MSAAGACFLGLLWGAIGGAGGVWWAIRREKGHVSAVEPPTWAARSGRLVGAALKPLGVALALFAVVGTVAWLVQSVRDAGHQRAVTGSHRATATALFDDTMFLADNGVHLFELSSGVGFHQPGPFGPNGMPLPATKVAKIAGPFSAADATTVQQLLEPAGSFRIFDYGNGIPTLEFVVLLLSIILPMLFATYGGFLLAREANADTPGRGAAWGALLGPIWCVAMVIINALVQKQIGGKAEGDSVLVIYLLGGAFLGALGGLLATQKPSPAAPDGGTGA